MLRRQSIELWNLQCPRLVEKYHLGRKLCRPLPLRRQRLRARYHEVILPVWLPVVQRIAILPFSMGMTVLFLVIQIIFQHQLFDIPSFENSFTSLSMSLYGLEEDRSRQ